MSSKALTPSTILQKTTLGADEIATRKGRVAGRLRPLLILVDGKLDVARLLAKCQQLGLSQEHLVSLLDSGMCEISVSSAIVAASEGSVEVQRRPTKRSVALARMHLLVQMERFLGADSETVRAAIRTAQSRSEVLQILEQSLEVVREMSGEDRAALVRERVLELLPD